MTNKMPLTSILIKATCAAGLIWAFFSQFNNAISPKNIQHMNDTICTREIFQEKSYIVCVADPKLDDIMLFLNGVDGRPYKSFSSVERMLKQNGKTLSFAMNAGMYHTDFSPVGLYIENGKTIHDISTANGVGNFYMKPNGVFYLEKGKAGIVDSETYLKKKLHPVYATQSGPMLVIQNNIHHRFIPNSTFLEYRNGVGVTETGKVIFVISEQRVNFNEMAHFFRDRQQTPNALFLDGSISSIFAPNLGRFDWWHSLGPMVGVVVDSELPPRPTSAN